MSTTDETCLHKIEILDSNEEYAPCPNSTGLSRIDCTCSYNDFFHNYLLQNNPCVISGVSKHWLSTKLWVTDEKCPNWNYLLNKYNMSVAPVADCGKKMYNAQEKCEMTLENYINYWIQYKKEGYPPSRPCLYLKDWHFVRSFPNEEIYQVPLYFASDWLNEYYSIKSELNDDYRFIYMGPRGSWTPLHEDVFSSYSWSVNICGRKRWILLPPGEEENYKDNLGNLTYDISLTNKASYNSMNIIDVIQEAGEAIFVPSGWHHQVWNLDDTISINHNWVNGCNVHMMWKSLKRNLDKVKKEISDCSDMDNWLEQCQIILKASYGIDLLQFYSFIYTIGKSRIIMMEKLETNILNTYCRLGKNHIVFDIKTIYNILMEYLSHPDIHSLVFSDSEMHPNEFSEELKFVLEKFDPSFKLTQ